MSKISFIFEGLVTTKKGESLGLIPFVKEPQLNENIKIKDDWYEIVEIVHSQDDNGDPVMGIIVRKEQRGGVTFLK